METVALTVAFFAAFSSLVNALVALFNAWRDYRGLTISIEPDPWAHAHPDMADLADECLLKLKIENRARTVNSIAQIRCRVDSEEHEPALDPPDLTTKPIGPFSSAQGWLKLPVNQLPPKGKKIEFAIVPVRGKRRVFRFTREAILPEF